jgi:NuA3 HAT complex component NTO1
MDKNSLFLHPVSKLEVPDYFDVIKEPMCWSFIDDKLEKNAYKRVEDFTVSLS